MKDLIFTGSGVAIVTPFTKDDKIDFKKLGELIDFQIKEKTDAIIICGTTGESSTLSEEEHFKAIKFAVDHTNKRVPVIAGTGSNDTRSALEYTKYAEEVGADAALMVTPYYNKTTQKGLVKHFTYVADNTNIPIILYNVPSRTGLNITPETYFELSKHERIVATKEANYDTSSMIKTSHLCGDNLHIYSGNDDQIVPILSIGGKGVISVLANVCPKQTHDICQLFFDGKVKESAKLQIDLVEVISSLFNETNPIPVKAAMNAMGFDVGHCRMPLAEIDEKNYNILINAFKNYGIIK